MYWVVSPCVIMVDGVRYFVLVVCDICVRFGVKRSAVWHVVSGQLLFGC